MSDPAQTPRELLAEAARRHGEGEVALWCADLIARRVALDDPDLPSLSWVGGAAGRHHLDRLRSGDPEPDYWPRVWGARGLLYVWHPAAEPAVLVGLGDAAWRVREMSAKVVRLREIGAAAELLVGCCGDEVPRVRVAALRALARVGEAEHVAAVRRGSADPEPRVAEAAEEALTELARRLDREL